MRTEILTYLRGLALGTFNVSDELPRDEGGVSLQQKNPKTIYVDVEQFEDAPLIQTLDGLGLHAHTTTVSVEFVVDAKNPPANYSSLVNSIMGAKDLNSSTEFFNSREAEVTTSTETDMLTTTVDLNYVKLR
jgi:hypothetical protein